MIGEKYVRKLLAWCPRESLERWIRTSAGKKQMKIESKIALLSKTIFILLIAGIFGVFSGGLFPSGHGGEGILSVHSENMIIANGTSVSAQSLYEDTSRSWRFPPLEFAIEQIDFTVSIKNATGGILWVDFISNDKVLRSEYVFGTEKIVLSAFEGYRWGYSSVDVLLRAIGEDVTISSIYIDVYHSHKDYNPILQPST